MAGTMAAASELVKRINQNKDQNVGSARQPSSSATQVLSTLAPVALFALVWFVLFLLFRKWFARNYRPRTFLGSLRPSERTPAVSDSLFGWIPEFWAIPDTWVLNHHTLDGYLFLRFLKIASVMCVVGCIITWPVLFPINATGGGGLSQLDLLTMANVQNNYYKYFAHCGCAMIFFTFVMYMITRESIYFINLRQAYLLSPLYAARISSRTVLFTSVPEDYMNEKKLRDMLGPQVRRIWYATDSKELEDKVEERDKAAMKLEGAETNLIVSANKARLAAEKKGEGPSAEAGAMEAGNNSIAARYLKPKDRPTHRLKPLIGKKVDTIDWCRGELKRLIPEVDAMQADQRSWNVKKLNSVFVEFETLSEAQAAYQSLAHHQVLHMAPRFTGMTPADVIWGNLRIKWWERVIRQFATTGAVVALIIFWSIPVAFVGAISNVNYLVKVIPAFKFILDIPKVVLGVVTGLLPVVLLTVLMILLPIFLRLMAKMGGDPTYSQVELTVQNSYFGFQVVQVFLVATLGSAASASVGKIIKNPLSVTSLLANKLPLANNFYLCYFILQGLAVVSGIMVGLVGLILFMLLGKLLDKTPRKMYKRWVSLSGLGWGTIFPIYTNLFVIALCYAAIAPLVLAFAAIGIYFFYVAYRYNLLFVYNSNIDTKGRIYPRALQQLFVGLYLAEICLIGLFAIGTANSVGAVGPMILMIIFLIFTVLYQFSLNSALSPLLYYLPKSMDAEERNLLAAEHGVEDVENGHYTGNGAEKPGMKSEAEAAGGPKEPAGAPHKKPNMFSKWLRPDIYTDYSTMRRLVPKEIRVEYPEQAEDSAYYHPAVNNTTPLLWVPRDPMGVSRQECAATNSVIPITDDGAYLDEKNKIVWDAQDGRPPIYEEPVYY